MNVPLARLFGCRLMTYSLEFHEKALAEYRDLDAAVQTRVKRKLAERLSQPHVAKDRLRGSPNRYKIKLMSPAVRVVYEVVDLTLIVRVIAIDGRERGRAYLKAEKR